MAKGSGIEWTDHTFNPWWGCAKVSPACDHCYAERDAGRYASGQVLWGVDAARREFGAKHWDQPRHWDNAARKSGIRQRVFCASMADVFDKNAPDGARDKLWQLIDATPNLDWLLLTKRIGNARAMLPDSWKFFPRANVWLGISVVTQAEADRDIPKLFNVPARLRFLSCEPLLGPIDLSRWAGPQCDGGSVPADGGGAPCPYCLGNPNLRGHGCRMLSWVIAGGESGPKFRPVHSAWLRSLRNDCNAAGVPFHFKQWGESRPITSGVDPVELLGASTRLLEVASGDPLCPAEAHARLGKKACGRLLDGRTWDEFPEVK